MDCDFVICNVIAASRRTDQGLTAAVFLRYRNSINNHNNPRNQMITKNRQTVYMKISFSISFLGKSLVIRLYLYVFGEVFIFGCLGMLVVWFFKNIPTLDYNFIIWLTIECLIKCTRQSSWTGITQRPFFQRQHNINFYILVFLFIRKLHQIHFVFLLIVLGYQSLFYFSFIMLWH